MIPNNAVDIHATVMRLVTKPIINNRYKPNMGPAIRIILTSSVIKTRGNNERPWENASDNPSFLPSTCISAFFMTAILMSTLIISMRRIKIPKSAMRSNNFSCNRVKKDCDVSVVIGEDEVRKRRSAPIINQ